MAVSQVASVCQVHAQKGIAGVERGHVDGLIGLRARVRLDVHVFGVEELLGALDGERFGHVHKLAAAVVALAGQALGVLVGQDRPERLQHRFTHKIFGGDQLERARLAVNLAVDRAGEFRIDFLERAGSRGQRRTHVVFSIFRSVARRTPSILAEATEPGNGADSWERGHPGRFCAIVRAGRPRSQALHFTGALTAAMNSTKLREFRA